MITKARLSQEEANEKLDKMVEGIKETIKAAEDFAKEYKLEFYLAPAYGMGGDYDGKEGHWNPSS